MPWRCDLCLGTGNAILNDAAELRVEAACMWAKAGELRAQAAAVEELLAVLEGTSGVESLADLMELSRAKGTDAEVVALVRRAFP